MATKKKPLDWALAPAPESADHVKISSQYELFIGGKWQKPKSGKYFDTINPANEKVLSLRTLILGVLVVFVSGCGSSATNSNPSESAGTTGQVESNVPVAEATEPRVDDTTAYKDLRFGMKDTQVRAYMNSTFKKLPKYWQDQVGEFKYKVIPWLDKDSLTLYEVDLESEPMTADHLDSDVDEQYSNLYEVIYKKYGQPHRSYDRVSIFDFAPGRIMPQDVWQMGNKMIRLCKVEEEDGGRYYVLCEIKDVRKAMQDANEYEARRDSAVRKDASKF